MDAARQPQGDYHHNRRGARRRQRCRRSSLRWKRHLSAHATRLRIQVTGKPRLEGVVAIRIQVVDVVKPTEWHPRSHCLLWPPHRVCKQHMVTALKVPNREAQSAVPSHSHSTPTARCRHPGSPTEASRAFRGRRSIIHRSFQEDFGAGNEPELSRGWMRRALAKCNILAR